ncbi:Os01g0383600 [Oryza sativa Japonica Group]|uniref:Os01g0383600 protein n=1 Tax=Oryza sativa subsp. japonica TaxID=39947 RepID=A0A0P0V2R3_ORYSJ|nr:Os01g0383600 [Oryza sativa Japonica Group]
MGLRDGFSINKLLDDFGFGEIQPVQVHLATRSEPSSSSTTWSIEIIQASSSAVYQKMSDHMISNEYAARVVMPNLPKKTDDLSHSAGHRWTTREKVVNG